VKIFKTALLLLVASVCTSVCQMLEKAPDVSDPQPPASLPPGGYFKIDGQTYTLMEKKSDPETGSSISEYTVEGESSRNWSSLVTIHDYPDMNSPEEYIQRICEVYKKNNPGMKFAQGSNNSRTEFWMDAIFLDAPGAAPAIPGTEKTVEWSFFKAARSGQGIRVLQYSERRRYENSPEEIFDEWDLRARRAKILPVLTAARMP